MRSVTTWALVAGLSLAVAATASAQERRQGRGQGRGMGGGQRTVAQLLASEDVQKELKLTDEQKTKAQEFAQSQTGRGRGLRGGDGQPVDREKLQAMQREAAAAGEKFVKDTLKPEQQKRLKQIQLQVNGVQSFASEEVQAALTLTAEQKEKVRSLSEDYQKASQELRGGGGGNFQELREKRQAMTKEYVTKAQALLTAEQKQAWKDLTGEPFTGQVTGGRGRRGGDR